MRRQKPGNPASLPQDPAFLSHLPRRLRKLLYRNYLRRSRFRTCERLGLRLQLNYANYVDRQLIIHEPYEAAQIGHLLQLADGEHFDRFIDVGSNFGLYAMLMARTGRFGEVIAFEPDPRNYHQLVTNIALNGMTREIRVFACGLSDRTSMAEFMLARGRSTGMSRIASTAPAATRAERYTAVRVPVIRYDEHFACRDCRVMVKIDVEGHEAGVIDGMQQLLGDNDCIVQTEVFDAAVGRVDALLGRLGYRNYAGFGHDRLYRRV